MPLKIRTLIDLGLVEMVGPIDRPAFSLTPAGSSMAEHLSCIESAIAGTKN